MHKVRAHRQIELFALLVILAFVFSLAMMPKPASASEACNCADYGAGWYPAPFWGGCGDCTTNPVYPSENCAPCGQTYAYCDGCYWDTNWANHKCAGSYCCECSGVGYQVAPFWGGCDDCTTNPVYPNYNLAPCGQAYAYCNGCNWNTYWDTHKCEGSYNPCYGVSCPGYCSGSTRYYGGYCSGGNCYYSSEDCGSNYVDGYYCYYGNSYATQHYRGCSGTSCYHSTENFLYDECPYGCSNGQCKYCGDGVCTASYETCGNCAADCGCSSGYVCSSGTCVLACSNECSYSGQTRCLSSSTRQTCGNYDVDSCLEWGSDYACPNGCSGGECITTGTCTCTACRDNDCTTFLGTDNCNFMDGYHPVCSESGCGSYPICMDADIPIDCTCVKNPECSDSGDCSNRAGSYSGTYQSFDCFNCNSGSCSFSSEGTQCSINFAHCLGLTGCPVTGTKYGDCSGSYCTCWEGMTCESNDRCQLCSNSYCTSGHCCTKGWYWDGSRCTQGKDACTEHVNYNLIFTPTWYYYGSHNYYGRTCYYACCPSVAVYGTTQDFFVPIEIIS